MTMVALGACAGTAPAAHAQAADHQPARRAEFVKLDRDQPAEPNLLPGSRQSKIGSIAGDPPPDQKPSPEPSCQFDEAGDDPPGFYRTDPWPKGEVVLTFDDGPHPYATPRVLKLLAQHHLPATFFVVGHSINGKTFHLLKRMLAEGHSLGSHSYNHDIGMGFRDFGQSSVQYIRGQHETTKILIDLALLSESETEFDALFSRVFAKKAWTYLSGRALRHDWPTFAARHAALLEDRGFEKPARPYDIKFSRPPGGGPYLGTSESLKRPYTAALAETGLLNVMWHGGSGDTDRERRRDSGFLQMNLGFHSRRGGILLIHDQMRHDALAAGLAKIAADPRISVVPLEQAVRRKFGCGSEGLRAKIASEPRAVP